jgi:ASC-1-like (ASCH) protein
MMRKHLSEPWFSLIKGGIKTIEGRIDKGEFVKGSELTFWNREEEFSCLVEEVVKYSSFEEMMRKEGLYKVLPGVLSIEEGVKIYRKYYSEADEKRGVIAIRLVVKE